MNIRRKSSSWSSTGVEKIIRDFSAFHFIKACSKGNSSNGDPSAEIPIRVSNFSFCSLFLGQFLRLFRRMKPHGMNKLSLHSFHSNKQNTAGC